MKNRTKEVLVDAGNLLMRADSVEGLMFTASMSHANMEGAYRRLIATAKSNDPGLREVKLCYVTVRPTPR